MLPYKSLITIDKDAPQAVYLQISHGLIRHIQSGVIQPGMRLPGTRVLSDLLQVHRKTIVHAIEELEAQGWVNVLPNRGVFVADDLPEMRSRTLPKSTINETDTLVGLGFDLPVREFLSEPIVVQQPLAITDGFPDVRLAPLNELATAYARQIRHTDSWKALSYADARGPERLRKILAQTFSRDRGLQLDAANMMITRGSQMAIYMAARVLLRQGDVVVIGETNYFSANLCFQTIGAELLRIPVDEQGLCLDTLERLCQSGKKIKAIYVTSHHHHPTTVTLSPERRLRLLDLAGTFGFAIIEDDYDYDFHYNNSPILPLASADRKGQVVYIGSFSKTTAPAFRVGYIVAATPVIAELVKLRRIIDRQGDTPLELAIADLLENGTIQRYRKKALKQYRLRRDLFCDLLEKELGDYLTFQRPEGGMAVWVQFDPKWSLPEMSARAAKKGMYLSNGLSYNPPGKKLNATRMGFAALNEKETQKAIAVLKVVMLEMKEGF